MIRQAQLVLVLALAGALPRGAAASEEEIATWKKATIVADAGKRFGDVEITAVAAGRGAGLASLSVKVSGKTIAVPAALLKDLPGIALHGLAVHHEAGYDKEPWLYVVLEHHPVPKGARNQWVYFAIQGGKLHHRTVKTQLANGQFKFAEKKP
jgi:hypothetical protein